MHAPGVLRSAWPLAAPAAALGATAALLLFAPAAWLRAPIAQLTGERLLLEQAQGSIWHGQARLILAGGAGSADRQRLPGTLDWKLRPALDGPWPALRLQLRQSCCMSQTAQLRLSAAGFGFALSLRLEDAPVPPLAVWPAAWLGALGTPWNTLQPGGRLSLATAGLELALGRAGPERMWGTVALQLDGASSSLSTLPTLGSYRITLQGQPQRRPPYSRPDPAQGPASPGAGPGGELASLQLQTLEGPLRLQALGSLGPRGLRLSGEARADAGREAALDNLLNLVGRRDGARSILSIGRP